MRSVFSLHSLLSCTTLALAVVTGTAPRACGEPGRTPATVRGHMQVRPGGPMQDVEVLVHAVPADLADRAASDAELPADDLVLGVIADGKPIAYPVRYLAMHEVVNDVFGTTALAATW